MRRDEQEKAVQLRRDGMSVNKIAKTLGVAKSSVSLWVRKVALTEEQRKKLLGGSVEIDPQKLRSLSDAGLSDRAIAKVLNLKKSTVRYRILSLGFRSLKNRPQHTNCSLCGVLCSEEYCRKCSTNVRRLLTKICAVSYLGGVCNSCGRVVSDVGVLAGFEFHHKDNIQKDFEIGSFMGSAWDRLVPELDKCELLCSFCHRMKHVGVVSDAIVKQCIIYGERLGYPQHLLGLLQTKAIEC